MNQPDSAAILKFLAELWCEQHGQVLTSFSTQKKENAA